MLFQKFTKNQKDGTASMIENIGSASIVAFGSMLGGYLDIKNNYDVLLLFIISLFCWASGQWLRK